MALLDYVDGQLSCTVIMAPEGNYKKYDKEGNYDDFLSFLNGMYPHEKEFQEASNRITEPFYNNLEGAKQYNAYFDSAVSTYAHEVAHCADVTLQEYKYNVTFSEVESQQTQLEELRDKSYSSYQAENLAIAVVLLHDVKINGEYNNFEASSAFRSLKSLQNNRYGGFDNVHYKNRNVVEEFIRLSNEAYAVENDVLGRIFLDYASESAIPVAYENVSAEYYVGEILEPIEDFISENGIKNIQKMSHIELLGVAEDIVGKNAMSKAQYYGDLDTDEYSFINAITEVRIDVNGEYIIPPDLAENNPNFIKYGKQASDYFELTKKRGNSVTDSVLDSVPRWMRNQDSTDIWMPEDSPISGAVVGKAISQDRVTSSTQYI